MRKNVLARKNIILRLLFSVSNTFVKFAETSLVSITTSQDITSQDSTSQDTASLKTATGGKQSALF